MEVPYIFTIKRKWEKLQILVLKTYAQLRYAAYNLEIAKDPRFITSSQVLMKLPQSTQLPHPVGIVIGSGVSLGENTKIYQNVTIGAKEGFPSIGDDVIIYSGATVIGDISIGNSAIIGANSLVIDDVPPGTTVAGVPARPVNMS